MADYTVKSHDRRPIIRYLIIEANGQPVDLTAALQVDFIMRAANGGPLKVNAPATVVDAPGGVVEYRWLTGDTDLPGNYQAEWEVHWELGLTETFPRLTYLTVAVLADLDGDGVMVDA